MDLPDKVYFRIGEVAEALGVQPHVVRFWQQQFPTVRPERSRTGRFLYTHSTIEQLAFIQRLLKDEGYTIVGAKKALRERGTKGQKRAADAPAQAAEDKGKTAALQAALKKAESERDSYKAQLLALRKVVTRETVAALKLLDD
mgnify:CR=1 FL=1